MFGIGIGEFILIMVVALLVIGPDKLPEIARSIAKAYNELRRTGNEFKRTVTSVADIDVIGIAEGKLGGEGRERGRAPGAKGETPREGVDAGQGWEEARQRDDAKGKGPGGPERKRAPRGKKTGADGGTAG